MTLWRQTFKVGCKVSLVSVHSLKDTPTLTKTVKHTKGFFNVISLTLERSDVVQTKKDDLDIPLRLGCCGWLPTVNASIGTDRQVLMGMPVIGNYSSCGLGIWFDQTLRNHVFFTAVKLLISTISVCVCMSVCIMRRLFDISISWILWQFCHLSQITGLVPRNSRCQWKSKYICVLYMMYGSIWQLCTWQVCEVYNTTFIYNKFFFFLVLKTTLLSSSNGFAKNLLWLFCMTKHDTCHIYQKLCAALLCRITVDKNIARGTLKGSRFISQTD